MSAFPAALVVAFLIPALSVSAFGDTPPAIVALVQKLTKACREQNLEAVKACYDIDGASMFEIDIALSPWQEYFNQSTDLAHWKFHQLIYRSLDDYLRDKTLNPNAAALLAPGREKMGEHFYEQNLKTIGFIISSFSDGHGSTIGNTISVGLMSDGTARLNLQRMVK